MAWTAKYTAFRIHQFVFKFCETSPATARRAAQTSPWPGICYYGGEAARVIWMDEIDDTYYDGEMGLPYSREALDADLAAAEQVIAAIRSNQVFASADKDMNQALQHVHAAVHLHTQAKQDWLEWMMDRLEEIPTLPVLNRRGKPKLQCRGAAKLKPKCACTRTMFDAKLKGLKGPEITKLWKVHKKSQH